MDFIERSMHFFVENQEFGSFNQIINSINLKVLEHGYLRTGTEWNFMDLSSPFNRLYFVLSGRGHIRNEQNQVALTGGNAYLVPLYNSYDYVCEDYLVKFYIHFRMELIPGHDLFEGSKACGVLPVEGDVITGLIESARDGSVGEIAKCKGILLTYIGKFMEFNSYDIGEQIKLASKYAALYGYVKDNCSARLRVKEIAEHLNMTVTNLSKAFKADTGRTLKSYIDSKMVQKAQELLLTTSLPVKDVAFRLDFNDEFHFSRFFKNHTGISPNKYRQRSNTFK